MARKAISKISVFSLNSPRRATARSVIDSSTTHGLAASPSGSVGRASPTTTVQVAMLGLVKAVDRFDPEYGVPFAAFAGSTIEGELKRHFRDHSWVVRVPRSAKDLHLLVRRATDELVQKSGRSPSVDEIAAHLEVERDDVLRGLAASSAYHVGTIQPGGPDGDTETPLDRVGALASEESGYDHALDTDLVARLLAQLPGASRRSCDAVLRAAIPRTDRGEVGVSQMQVSRLLRGSFEKLREWMDDES
jgi:RNA polymerase sigma-B factor